MPSDEAVTQRARSLRSLPGLTEADFMALLPHCEQALVVYLQDRPIAGQPRTSRRYRPYAHSPLATSADKRLFMLTYVTQHPLQEGQGQLFGTSPSKAHKWIQLLHPVVHRALADQAWLPARTADDLTALLTTPPIDASAPCARLFMRGPHDPSSVRKTRRSSKRMTVGRRNATRAKTSS